MNRPTDADLQWARERVGRLQANQITLFAAFRDGLHVDLRHLQALDRAGLAAALGDGSYVALPGVMQAFTERYGPPLRGGHEVRRAGRIANEERAAIFAAIPGCQAPPVTERRPPARSPERSRPNREAHQGAGGVAVPAARESGVHPWHGSRVIAGDNPIGEIVQKLRRST